MATRHAPPPYEHPLAPHQLLLYGNDTEFLTSAGPFVEAGLASGEPVFVATGTHNANLLRRRFGPGPTGVYYATDDWYRTPAQAMAAYHEQARHNGPTRVIGEPRWLGRTGRQTREWARFEALLNLTLATTGARHLCPYDIRTLPRGVLRVGLLTHPALSTANGERPNPAHIPPRAFSAACDSTPLPAPPAGHHRLAFHTVRDLTDLRHFVARHARPADLDPDRLDRLVLCADEAAANAVLHGGRGGICRLWVDDTHVVCDLTDPAGTLDTALAGYLPPDPNNLHGRGLWIIRQLADIADTRATTAGTTIRIHMRRTPTPRTPPRRNHPRH